MDKCKCNYVNIFKKCMKSKIIDNDYCEYLQRNCKNELELNGDTLLHLAVQEHADFEVIKTIANEENINATNNNGKTPLYIALESHFMDIESINYLINKGAKA